MYRLLKFRKWYPMKSTISFSPSNNQFSFHSCTSSDHNLIPKSHNFDLLYVDIRRFQSTKANTVLLNSIKMKKKRRLKKKYAELLEVTGDSSSEKKAFVSNLKAKHFSSLVDQPNINLAQLHNLKKSKTKSVQSVKNKTNYKLPLSDVYEPAVISVGSNFDLNSLQDFQKSAIANDLDPLNCEKKKPLQSTDTEYLHLDTNNLIDSELQHHLAEELDVVTDHVEEFLHFEEPSLENALGAKENETLKAKEKKGKQATVVVKNLKKHAREQVAKVKLDDLERAGKEEGLSRSLFSYLEICVNCGLLNRGFSTLTFYRARNKRFIHTPRVVDIRLFNLLLHAFGGKGNISKVKEILQILKEDQIPLNIQSYAACFECVGRLSNTPTVTKMLDNLVEGMQAQGFSLNDLMAKCSFVGDQREVILNVIRRLQPDFEPIILPPEMCYSCDLLQDLNVTEKGSFKSPVEGLLTSNELKQLLQEQIQIEMQDYIKVKTIEKRLEPNETILHYRSKLEETKLEWEKTITEAYRRDLNTLRAQHQSFKSYRHINLYPFLKALDPRQCTDIIMQEIRKLAEGSETFSPTTNQLHRDLGNQVRSRYQVKYKVCSGIMDKVGHLYEDYCDWYADSQHSSSSNTRQQWQHLIHVNQQGPSVNAGEKQWPYSVLVGVGKFMYNIIMRDIKIDVNITKTNSKTKHMLPAFYTLFRTQGKIMKEELKPHPILSRLFRGAASEDLIFEVTNAPMLSPPLPWSSVSSGGYLVAKADIIRLPQQAVQQWHRLMEMPVPQLYPALDSLNQLGAVPWRVNQPVLDVVVDVFNSGGSMRLDIPEPPSACPPPDFVTPDMSKQERFQAYRNRMALRRRKAEMYSLWCDTLYRLSLANHFRDRIFWLPHNMDFRGRVYPCPPHLNHLGSDMARSILCFAKGEKLGPKGLDWLKIHLVNLTGLKKKNPISERLIYAEELLPEIMDSAENPLKGRMWWAKSEEAWQTLACCMEICRAIKSNDPENYVCHFPVHQDGSCNGLQHYAALGRDRTGAESVNLSPALQPQDVYSRVATLVERERAKDALLGLPLAKTLDGFISRKVIKQTVMTTVYGVTRFGARLQIGRQLKDLENFPKEFVWPSSTYLSGKTFDSLREMFTSTKEIQDWFTECARLISQVCGQNVEWVTPLGLPVVQPYNRPHKKIESGAQSNNKLAENCSMDMFERPNVMKQKNAFPPNFIHSLDSSHMMLTSLFCERKGITFVSVHDCFWTHPSSVDVMNKVCREQFVSLHSQPILEDLSKFLMEKYSYPECDLKNDGSLIDATKRRLNSVLVNLPRKGDFQLDNVLKSTYFFS